MGGWLCIDTLSWTKKKFSSFLLFLYRNDIRTFFCMGWIQCFNVFITSMTSKKNFLYYFYGRKHVFVCSLASRNVILIYNKNNFSLFRFITFFNATIKIFCDFCLLFWNLFIYFFDLILLDNNNLIGNVLSMCLPTAILWLQDVALIQS